MKLSLRLAAISTLNYARFFDYPLTIHDLHLWLISPRVIAQPDLSRLLTAVPDAYTKELHLSLPPKRLRRLRLTQQKVASLTPLIYLISRLPTIRLIALTGSLAVDNAKPRDDLDLMVITRHHSLWLTRFLVTFILFLGGKKRPPASPSSHPDTVCINLWLDTTSLAVPHGRQNLYTAHEVLQIKPLYDRGGTYQHFLQSNSWTKKFLANAYHQLTLPSSFKADHLLLFLLIPFNLLFFTLQYLYMKRKITTEHITLHSAYFHPRDLSLKITTFLKSVP